VSPERYDIRYSLSRPGYIEAFEQTPIYPKLAGYAANVRVDIGSEVKPGDLLAEVRIPEMSVELQQKEALVAKAKADLGSTQAKVKAVRAGILRARAEVKRWDVEQRRQQRFVQEGTLQQQSLDAVEAQLETAKAAQAEAEAEVAKAEADVEVARNAVRVAEANKDYVATMLEYTKVRAPYAGVVIKRNVNTDDLVQPVASSGRKGEALFVVARTDKGVRIFVDVPEAPATAIDERTRALIRVRAHPGLEVEGKVSRSAWALDPGAKTLRTEIDVEQPGKLRPGMYAYVTLTVEHKDVWTLPASAVVMKDNEAYCFQVSQGRAVKTPLQPGLSDGKRVEVFKIKRNPGQAGKGDWEDFTGTEQVVQGNTEKLAAGQEVTAAVRKK
jgi:multidrug resistance efflux pump